MKTTLLSLCFAFLFSFSGRTQPTAATKLHFLNLMVGSKTDIQVGPDKKDKISIYSRNWTVFTATGNAVSLFIDEKLYSLPIEPGKSYYFMINSHVGSRPKIAECAEREFLLTAAILSIKGPVEYAWPTSTNPQAQP